jgi:hypothetical protein
MGKLGNEQKKKTVGLSIKYLTAGLLHHILSVFSVVQLLANLTFNQFII